MAVSPDRRTGIGDHNAFTSTVGARLSRHELTENGLLHSPHFTGAVADGAAWWFRAAFHPGAVAVITFLARQLDLAINPEHRFQEVASTTACRSAPRCGVLLVVRRRRAKKAFEEIANRSAPNPPYGSPPPFPIPVGRTTKRHAALPAAIRQHFIGFVDFLEVVFSFGGFIDIGMILPGKSPVCLLSSSSEALRETPSTS